MLLTWFGLLFANSVELNYARWCFNNIFVTVPVEIRASIDVI
jgi:hypothetical protein